MQLHTYRGNTMSEALVAVKRGLGADAVVVHTRTFKIGAVMGIGGKEVVEITALASPPQEAHVPCLPRSRVASQRGDVAKAGAVAVKAERSGGVTNGSVARKGSLPRARVSLPTTDVEATNTTSDGAADSNGAVHVMRVRQRGVLAPIKPRAAVSESSRSVPPETTGKDEQSELRRELSDLRAMIERFATNPPAPAVPSVQHHAAQSLDHERSLHLHGAHRQSSEPAVARATEPVTGGAENPLPPTLFEQHLQLVQQHTSRELADEIMRAVRADLSENELNDDERVQRALAEQLTRLIPISRTSITPVRSEGEPFTIALVGPTGVGKTSTIAKLAAAYKVHQGLSVALITTDTSRPGVVEQLAGFAKILGVPMAVASTAEDIVEARREFAHADVILVDTAGVSIRDAGRLRGLGSLLEAAWPTETHLVLSGTMSEPMMRAAAQAFSPVAPNRVLFTKLDESVTYGVILTVAATLGVELSFLTNGTELSGNIEAPCGERFARLFVRAAA